MRKLILVAALATMWTSSCYANLSLASNSTAAPLPPAVVEAKAQATDVEAAPKAPEAKAPEVKASEVRRATVAKSPSRPRRNFSNRTPFIRSFAQHCL